MARVIENVIVSPSPTEEKHITQRAHPAEKPRRVTGYR